MAIRLAGVDRPSTLNEPTVTPMGAFVLADNPNLYERQRENNFEFIVEGLEELIRAGMIGNEAQARIANARDVLRLSVSSASIPHYTQQALETKRGNTTIKAAGAMVFEAGSLTLYDYIGADTKSVLMAWQNLSGNIRTEKVGLMSDYKKKAWLVEMTPDQQVVRRWILEGCWISGISESAYNWENNANHNITATIQYDKGYIDTSEYV